MRVPSLFIDVGTDTELLYMSLNRMNKTIKVLIVEDDLLSQMVAKFLLQELDCEADLARSEEEALEKANTRKYDVIFMDIGLGKSNGFIITEKIKSHSENQATPVIAITAHQTMEHQEQAKAAGMTEFITKPLEKDKVHELLTRYTSYCLLDIAPLK